MKLVCSRDALAEALAVAGSVVVSRTPSPVLLCWLEHEQHTAPHL